jgi:hypothetical protein
MVRKLVSAKMKIGVGSINLFQHLPNVWVLERWKICCLTEVSKVSAWLLKIGLTEAASCSWDVAAAGDHQAGGGVREGEGTSDEGCRDKAESGFNFELTQRLLRACDSGTLPDFHFPDFDEDFVAFF